MTETLPKMRVLSLCTGIGGVDLAAVMTGLMEIIGQVEIDPFCCAVLAKHDDLWPNVRRLHDIKEVVGDEFGAVDLLVAGFPCQPSSTAGKRRGAEDPRWLWPDVDRIIRCARPTWVLLENVPGLISLGLDDVLGDLERAGYEAAACLYPAAAVGAPHERDRIFIVAYAQCLRRERREGGSSRRDEYAPWANWQEAAIVAETAGARDIFALADASSGQRIGPVRASPGRDSLSQPGGRLAADGCGTPLADTNQHGGRRSQRADAGDVDCSQGTNVGGQGYLQRSAAERGGSDVADTTGAGLSLARCVGKPTQTAQVRSGVESEPQRCSGWQVESGVGGDIDGFPSGLDRHLILSHRWPSFPGEAQYDYEPPRTVTQRQPGRSNRLKALGNAVVPQQCFPLLLAIAQTWIEQERQPVLWTA